jgi:F-type H+-transporting ATPase subunit b
MLNIDLSALVTVLYIIIVYVFLSRVFFGPVVKVMNERKRLIEGRLDEAHKRMAQAERKATEYETALKTAQGEAYRVQEANREKALLEKTELVTRAKLEAEKAVEKGRERIATEAESAKQQLVTQADTLARQLKTSILRD